MDGGSSGSARNNSWLSDTNSDFSDIDSFWGEGTGDPAVAPSEFALIACPACHQSIRYLFGRTPHLVCPACHTPFTVSTTGIELSGNPLNGKASAPAIPLGSRGEILGATWTVLGWLRSRTIDARVMLFEYQIYNEFWGMGWLLHASDDWFLLRRTYVGGKGDSVKAPDFSRLTIEYAAGAFEHPVSVTYGSHFIARHWHNELNLCSRDTTTGSADYEMVDLNARDLSHLHPFPKEAPTPSRKALPGDAAGVIGAVVLTGYLVIHNLYQDFLGPEFMWVLLESVGKIGVLIVGAAFVFLGTDRAFSRRSRANPYRTFSLIMSAIFLALFGPFLLAGGYPAKIVAVLTLMIIWFLFGRPDKHGAARANEESAILNAFGFLFPFIPLAVFLAVDAVCAGFYPFKSASPFISYFQALWLNTY